MLALPERSITTLDHIHHSDALTLLRGLASQSVDAIITDPPYNGVKEDAWDNQWKTDADYLAWLQQLLVQFRRVLKSNGSLYLFASPKMAARVEILVQAHFNVLNSIRWIKDAGWHNKQDKEIIRSYLQPWEAVIFAEQHASDNRYASIEYELNGQVYAPLKDWFRGRVKAHGIGLAQLNAALGAATNGGGLASGYFGDKVEFQLPTADRYQQMQTAFPAVFNRDYGDLRQQYEGLRQQYEGLRRTFDVDASVPYTDVWNFPAVQGYPGKHPCEKPLEMMEHIVKASTRPGAVVLDCFCGSGSTLDAARRNGRHFIGCDFSGHWCKVARQRVATPYMRPMWIDVPRKQDRQVTPELKQRSMFAAVPGI